MIQNLNSINLLVIGVVANFFLLVALGPDLFSATIFNDDGAMSIFNMLLILAAWGICLLQFIEAKGERVRWFCWIYVVQIYLLREADFHQAFTEINVTKAIFYTAENIPFDQKLVAGIITLGFLVCLSYLLSSNARTYIRALKEREPWAVSLALWFMFLFCSQLLDKTSLNSSANWKLRAIEEMFEVTAAIYVLLAIFFYWQKSRDVDAYR